MLPNPSIAIVLPVYNESPVTLSRIVDELHTMNFQIFVVDDGSDIPVKLRKENLFILRHRINLGQGAALETGMEFARLKDMDIVIHMDADGQHQVTDIHQLLKPIISGKADIVIGSRFLSSSSVEIIPKRRKQLLRFSRFVNQFFTSIDMTDAHNGFRALNKKALHSIFLQSNGRAHASEIVWRAVKQKLRIMEVPVHILYPETNDKILFPELIRLGFSLMWKRLHGYNLSSSAVKEERILTISLANKTKQTIS